MKFTCSRPSLAITLLLICLTCSAQEKRKIIIDQDAAGPAGTDQQSMLVLIQSPKTQILGITVVTGDAWLNDEVAHTLRMLELIGRTDIRVVPGAEYPLLRRKDETELWEQRYGAVAWLGAWTPRLYHPPDEIGNMPEGKPTTKPADEDAPHFLIRMIRKYPNEVSVYAGGPMTNLALALSIDPELPKLAKELVFMGGEPQSADNRPRIHQYAEEGIQSLVRSGGGSQRSAGSVEKDRLHVGRYFREDEDDHGVAGPNQGGQFPRSPICGQIRSHPQ
jgi:inosine-uridine preferring nucleoside hydrolase